ncbi:CHAT domain-containing protein [Winogradskyella sp. A3E31]|uniref:CHAT domain-containing protein n=1 Tax=Winogradskyella sp. A3E31 TaxID=3349637 RepID=UPI00398A776D
MQISDSILGLGKSKEALQHVLMAKQEQHTPTFQTYLNARQFYINGIIREIEGGRSKHSEALEFTYRAKNIIDSLEGYTYFKFQISNRLYHQLGYLIKWKESYNEAKLCLNYYLDTLSIKTPDGLALIDDLGYINKQLGDYQKSLEFYDQSMAIYREEWPEEKWDIAMNNIRIADNYRILGMRRSEYNVLNELENYCKDPEPTLEYFIKTKCYSGLAKWYTYYGDIDEAERYLFKQKKLIESYPPDYAKVNEKEQRERTAFLNLYADFIEFYIKIDNYKKANDYLNKYRDYLLNKKLLGKYDVRHEALFHYYNFKIEKASYEDKKEHLLKAIEVADYYKEEFHLDSNPYKIELLELLVKNKDYPTATSILKELNGAEELRTLEKFILYSNGYKIHEGLGDLKAAEDFAIKAFSSLTISENAEEFQKSIPIDSLKPIYTTKVVDYLLDMSSFLNRNAQKLHGKKSISASKNIGYLASQIFDKLYLETEYTQTLSDLYSKIKIQLLQNVSSESNTTDITNTLEALENNYGKQTWYKYTYQQTKPLWEIPDSLISREEDLTNLVRYYHKTIYNDDYLATDIDTLRIRLSEATSDLDKLQDAIRENFGNYTSHSKPNFSLVDFQEKLRKKDAVLKYFVSDDTIHLFLIDTYDIRYYSLSNSNDILNIVSEINRGFEDHLSELPNIHSLNTLLPRDITNSKYENVTIIADGELNNFPFEIIFWNEEINNNMSEITINYAESLLLYQEQLKQDVVNSPSVGLFTHNYSGQESLPSVSKEIDAISKYFQTHVHRDFSSDSLLTKAKNYDMLHFALHAEVSNDPSASFFSLGNERFYINSFYNENLPASLAVLSACDTGTGKYIEGDGLKSISRAFHSAGVPSTLVSLWEVDDYSTSKIITGFYKYLKEGHNKAEALKKAKIDYLNNTQMSELKHPYYWAGIVLIGNKEAIVEHNTFSSKTIALLSLLIITIGGGIIISKKNLRQSFK